MSATSVFSTGEEADQRVKEKIDEQEKRRAQGGAFQRRWWMPKTEGDEGKFLTFLDDPLHPAGYSMPVVFLEHQLHLNGHWRNWFTCIDGAPHPDTGEPQVCPICQIYNDQGRQMFPASLVAAYSAIDNNEWTDRQGQLHKNELILFVCKSAVHMKLKKAMKKKKTLRGWKVEISRPTSDDPSTGSDLEWLEQVEVDKEIVVPDYRELFAPKTQEELQKILASKSSKPSESSQGSARAAASVDVDDDIIPF